MKLGGDEIDPPSLLDLDENPLVQVAVVEVCAKRKGPRLLKCSSCYLTHT